MENFLALKGLTNCIVPKPGTPAVTGTSTTEAVAAVPDNPALAKETDESKLASAKAYLSLGVDTALYVHIRNCSSAIAIWNCLQKLYEDRGLYRKIALLGNLLSNKLNESDGMQNYVDKIVTAANKLQGVGFSVNDEWLGAILLSGLTEDFKPFIMGLEANGVGISGDLIMSKLLDCRESGDKNHAFLGKKPGKKFVKKRWPRRCFNCGSATHLANACDQPKTERKGDKNDKSAKAAFMMGFLGASNKNKWYVDSGATRHMSPHEDLIDNKEPHTDKITAADGEEMAVRGTGDAKVSFNDGNVKVKKLMHVPGLAVNLLSVSQIVQSGNVVVFDSDGCSIYNGDKERVLFCKSKNGVYEVEADENKCLLAKLDDAYTWHRRLGHASYPVITVLIF